MPTVDGFFRSRPGRRTISAGCSRRRRPCSAAPPTRGRPRARLHRWQSTEVFDYAEASHDAYGRLADPVIHRRRVLFVKPGYWLFVDDLDGRAEHAVELRFQFAPIEVTVGPDLWARARVSEGRGLLIKPFAAVSLKGEVHEGDLAPIQGWISPVYGRRGPAPALIYSTVARLPLCIMTLLLPTERLFAAPPAVIPLLGAATALLGIVPFEGAE